MTNGLVSLIGNNYICKKFYNFSARVKLILNKSVLLSLEEQQLTRDNVKVASDRTFYFKISRFLLVVNGQQLPSVFTRYLWPDVSRIFI